jgi:biopolymer transport protein ExbD
MRPRWIVLALLVACGGARERTLRSRCEAGDPGACDVLSARYAYGDGLVRDPAAAIDFGARAMDLCSRADGGVSPSCMRYPRAVRLDAPVASAQAASAEAKTVLTIVLAADGTTLIDGSPVADDEAILAAARTAREANEQLRAVIKADSSVPHGRVIHVLDLLKQAGVGKIAFGVAPVGTAPAPP